MYARILLPLLAAAIVSGQTISTFAGNGTSGYAGDGGPAAQAEINRVVGLATDAAGNVYLADQNNNVVRKVDTSGVITTFAGTGVAGFSGDGGQAAQAQLNQPLGVCVAPDGSSIYVNDEGNARVREISPAGIIKTVAGSGSTVSSGDGGPATSAGMVIPIRCAVDHIGNLFIVDQGAFRIRKVDTHGIITTYAGTGAQGFSGDGGPATQAVMNNPTADAVDTAGNLYVTDQFNQRIRRIDAATGTITTVAGNGNTTFGGDGGPATSAGLNYPGEIILDPTGAMFIVDTLNQRIREVSGGVISTIAGTGVEGYTGDDGPPLQAELNNPFPITVDGRGNLYIGDVTNNRVREITGVAAPVGPNITSVVSSASYQPGMVPNSWVTIFGSNFSTITDFWTVVDGKFPTQVDGVSVSVNGTPAYVEFVSSGQINVVAPNVGTGPMQVTVTNSLGTSLAYSTTSAVYGPGFFLWDNQYAVATYTDYTYALKNGAITGLTTVPAKPGDVLILWGTGFGPTTPAAPPGEEVPTTATYSTTEGVTVTVGGISATVYGAALAGGYAGLYQVAIQVPPSAPDGDLPVVAKVGGVSSPLTTLLTVQK